MQRSGRNKIQTSGFRQGRGERKKAEEKEVVGMHTNRSRLLKWRGNYCGGSSIGM
jgi:hypothetical protein